MTKELDFTVMNLGECKIPSPMSGVRFVKEDSVNRVYCGSISNI
jgi:hypothetical protein